MYCGEGDRRLFDDETRRQVHAFLNLFRNAYEPIHGWVATVLCVYGLVTNLMHVLVLSRPKLRACSINCLLTVVALCDMGTMGSYLTYLSIFVWQPASSCRMGFHKSSMQFLIVHSFLTIYLHRSSLWLAVSMALFRFMVLRKTRLSSRWTRSSRGFKMGAAVFACVMLFSVPNLFMHRLVELPAAISNCSIADQRGFTIDMTKMARENGCRLFKINLWVTGIMFKFIPTLLLVVLSVALLRNVRKRTNTTRRHSSPNPFRQIRQRIRNRDNIDRTTFMLIAILLIFFATELPQGVLAILSAVYTEDIYFHVYSGIGDILDLLSLINSSVNFLLYCLMSSTYRSVFCSLLFPQKIRGPIEGQTPEAVEMATSTDPASRSRCNSMLVVSMPYSQGRRLTAL